MFSYVVYYIVTATLHGYTLVVKPQYAYYFIVCWLVVDPFGLTSDTMPS